MPGVGTWRACLRKVGVAVENFRARIACGLSSTPLHKILDTPLLIAPKLDVKFVELLKYRFKRHLEDGFMLDIYDGCVYQEQHEFSDPYNISFSLNYDGAPKFKSSNMQIWPIQLCINELPPKLQYDNYRV